MKSIYSLAIVLLSSCSLFGQITTTKVAAPKQTEVSNTKYDSIDNFVGANVNHYVGQELYLTPKSETLRTYGYEGFVVDPAKGTLANKDNVYKCCDNFNSKYVDLAGKYFTVLEIVPDPKGSESTKHFLKLKEKESGDVVYYQYDQKYKYSFPFIVVGYFEKAKRRYTGKQYVLRGRNWIDKTEKMSDIVTGESVDFSAGTVWKCTDVTIEEKYYQLSLIIENPKGNKLTYSVDNILKGTYFAFPKDQADAFKKKFGNESWDIILKGEVKVGMTSEMCKLSWGEPKKINETITSGTKAEQWIYGENYLYVKNGLLTGIQ